MPSTSDAPTAFTDAWILDQRPARNSVDPHRPYAYMVEPECNSDGVIQDVATIFLTNAECPFRCLMCDLWKNTTTERVQSGMIAEQIRWALDQLPPARHVKLYNSGNFFDPNAIPPEDYEEIAELVSGFDTVIVESHPSMLGRRCLTFEEMLSADLHVAIGLETVHPQVLPKLNKRMTLDQFRDAVAMLRTNGMHARAFILLRPPFLREDEGLLWAKRSIDFAFDVGVECCAVIPTRSGNGAMEILAERGDFHPPSFESLEAILEHGLTLGRGRVFVDLWDAAQLAATLPNAAERIERLQRMNLTQTSVPHPSPNSEEWGTHHATPNDHATRNM